jgi:hypothetical protein
MSTKKQAMLSRVQEQKDCDIVSMFKKRLKWQEKKSHLEIEAISGKYPQQVIVPNSEVATTMKPKDVHCVLIVPNGPTPLHPSQATKVDATTSKLVGISNLTMSSFCCFLCVNHY